MRVYIVHQVLAASHTLKDPISYLRVQNQVAESGQLL